MLYPFPDERSRHLIGSCGFAAGEILGEAKKAEHERRSRHLIGSCGFAAGEILGEAKKAEHERRSRHLECDDDFFDLNAASGCDCTGLIPAAAVTQDEFDSYEELYDFLPPKPPRE
ncbi:MAG: hypothetical protein ACI4KM_12610 [Oscillospiraceae bacterium]